MKNLLIATTALVATAGMAAAEINFSGGARFGVTYDESLTPGVEKQKFTTVSRSTSTAQLKQMLA